MEGPPRMPYRQESVDLDLPALVRAQEIDDDALLAAGTPHLTRKGQRYPKLRPDDSEWMKSYAVNLVDKYTGILPTDFASTNRFNTVTANDPPPPTSRFLSTDFLPLTRLKEGPSTWVCSNCTYKNSNFIQPKCAICGERTLPDDLNRVTPVSLKSTSNHKNTTESPIDLSSISNDFAAASPEQVLHNADAAAEDVLNHLLLPPPELDRRESPLYSIAAPLQTHASASMSSLGADEDDDLFAVGVTIGEHVAAADVPDIMRFHRSFQQQQSTACLDTSGAFEPPEMPQRQESHEIRTNTPSYNVDTPPVKPRQTGTPPSTPHRPSSSQTTPSAPDRASVVNKRSASASHLRHLSSGSSAGEGRHKNKGFFGKLREVGRKKTNRRKSCRAEF